MKTYPQNPTDMQNQQPMHIQNPFTAQIFSTYTATKPNDHAFLPTDSNAK